VTTYLCETGLCAFAVMKTNYQSGLIMEKELWVAISSATLWFGKLRVEACSSIMQNQACATCSPWALAGYSFIGNIKLSCMFSVLHLTTNTAVHLKLWQLWSWKNHLH